MATTGRLELLQITLIVRDLPAAEAAFHEALGLEVAFRDPGVDLWGLENVVLPMGTTFIEILAPTRSDTPGSRHLDRQGGDGGYMVILQTHDLAPWRERIESLGLRVAFELKTETPAEGDTWEGIHLHPGDTGGLMISLDNPQPASTWAGAGPDWRAHVRQDVVDGLVAITLRSLDP
ncbi:MAG: VOC family protein, partial [Myxococcota bacterium]